MTNQPVEYVRRLPDTETRRNASITVRATDIFIDGVHREPGFEIISIHSCWTGREWLQIVNKDEKFTFGDAVKTARAMCRDIEG